MLLPAARWLADDATVEPFAIDVADPASHPFHGRDVFAPAVARVHEVGVDRLHGLDDLSPVGSVVDLTFPEPEVGNDGATGEVLAVDGFGSAVTNLPGGLRPSGTAGPSSSRRTGPAATRRSASRPATRSG